MKNPEFYTEDELTSFGEYLLSAQRLETLFPGTDPAGVYHPDIANWKAKVGGAGVEMGEEHAKNEPPYLGAVLETEWGNPWDKSGVISAEFEQRVSLALKARKETGDWEGNARQLCMLDARAAAVIHANGW